MSITGDYTKIYFYNNELGLISPKTIDIAENYLRICGFDDHKSSLKSDIFFLDKSKEDEKLTDPIICLRCRVSKSIYLTLQTIFEKNKSSGLELAYLASFVLDDYGKHFIKLISKNKTERLIFNWETIKNRQDLTKPLSIKVLRTFNSKKSNLNTWTIQNVRGNQELKLYLKEFDIQLLSKWPRIANASKSKIKDSLLIRGYSEERVRELLLIHQSFVNRYKEEKKIFRMQKGRQSGWEPDSKFLESLSPSQSNEDNLNKIYNSLIQYTKNKKLSLDDEGNNSLNKEIDDSQNRYLDHDDFIDIGLGKILETEGREIIKEAINLDSRKWGKDKKRKDCWLLYAKGLSQREIAKRCSHKQAWVSKLLKEKKLSEKIALNTIIKLSKFTRMEKLKRDPKELDNARNKLRDQILNPNLSGGLSYMQKWISEVFK